MTVQHPTTGSRACASLHSALRLGHSAWVEITELSTVVHRELDASMQAHLGSVEESTLAGVLP